MKKVVIVLAAVLLVAAVCLLFAGNYFYSVAIARQPKDFLKGDPALTTAVSKSGWGKSRIQGVIDTFVPYPMVRELYEAASCEKELLTVPGAGHGESFWADPSGYRSAVGGFIDKYIGD